MRVMIPVYEVCIPNFVDDVYTVVRVYDATPLGSGDSLSGAQPSMAVVTAMKNLVASNDVLRPVPRLIVRLIDRDENVALVETLDGTRLYVPTREMKPYVE